MGTAAYAYSHDPPTSAVAMVVSAVLFPSRQVNGLVSSRSDYHTHRFLLDGWERHSTWGRSGPTNWLRLRSNSDRAPDVELRSPDGPDSYALLALAAVEHLEDVEAEDIIAAMGVGPQGPVLRPPVELDAELRRCPDPHCGIQDRKTATSPSLAARS